MFSEIQISNFKGIHNLDLKDLGRFNILIGKNDSNKSTVLEAIYGFKAALFEPIVNFKTVARYRFRNTHAREIWHNYQPQVDPTIQATIQNKRCTLTYHSDFDFQSVDITLNIDGSNTRVLKIDSLITKLLKDSNPKFYTLLEGQFSSGLKNMFYCDEMERLRLDQFENYVQSQKLTPRDVYDKSITNFSFLDYSGGEKRAALGLGGGARFLGGYGDGHKSGLSLLTRLAGMQNTVVIIEEIETHQHPDSLRNLITNLIKICTDKNIQVFLSTHSPEVLQLFSSSNETQIFHLHKEKNNEISANQITHDDINMIKDIGWNIGNILAYEKLILVEGELDKAVLENSFHKLKGIWPEEVGINVLISYGLTKQKELLKTLSSPEKSIFVQRDLDDKLESEIKTEVFDGFKELEGEGYNKSETNDKITLTKDNTVKQLIKNNVFVTGLPDHFTQTSTHTIDDFLLYILEKDPSILSKIPGANSTLSNLPGESSKKILHSTLGYYSNISAMTILKEASTDNFPNELSTIIEKIYSD